MTQWRDGLLPRMAQERKLVQAHLGPRAMLEQSPPMRGQVMLVVLVLWAFSLAQPQVLLAVLETREVLVMRLLRELVVRAVLVVD
jgi:hypothetical protein